MKEHLSLGEIRAEIRSQAKRAKSYRALAQRMGVSPQMLCAIVKGKKRPGPVVLGALGFEAVTTYKRRKPDESL